MPVLYAAGAKSGAECHATAGGVAFRAAAGASARDPPGGRAAAARTREAPAHASRSTRPPPAGTPRVPRFATEPSAAPRAVKGGPAAVRPAFAIVARRMSGLYDLMLLV